MKHIKYLSLLMLASLLLSCNEKAKTLKPVSSVIGGPLSECFEVVVRDYKIIGDKVNIEFIRIKNGCPDSQIIAEFLDNAGNVVTTSKIDMLSNKEELSFLYANKVGESSTIAFEISDNNVTQIRFDGAKPKDDVVNVIEITENMEYNEDVNNEITYKDVVELDDDDEGDDVEEDDDKDDEDEEVEEDEEEFVQKQPVKSSGSKDWDKFLDDYESYVDQYIKLMKKANNGDMTAMTEYMTMLEKAQVLGEEIDKAKGDLSPAQLNRYMRILQKLTDAAINLY